MNKTKLTLKLLAAALLAVMTLAPGAQAIKNHSKKCPKTNSRPSIHRESADPSLQDDPDRVNDEFQSENQNEDNPDAVSDEYDSSSSNGFEDYSGSCFIEQ